MLIEVTKLNEMPVLSLHTGSAIGRITESIIDPNDLKIIAWRLSGPLVGKDGAGDILLARSVREFSSIGMIVDSIDELISVGDVVSIDKILDLNFSPLDMKVVTKKGTKLGRVKDFTVTTDDFRLMQLIVQRPTLKSFLDSELIVSRSEIFEVDDYKITVRDEEEKIRENSMHKDFVPNFVNPFREANLAPNHKESPVAEDTE